MIKIDSTIELKSKFDSGFCRLQTTGVQQGSNSFWQIVIGWFCLTTKNSFLTDFFRFHCWLSCRLALNSFQTCCLFVCHLWNGSTGGTVTISLLRQRIQETFFQHCKHCKKIGKKCSTLQTLQRQTQRTEDKISLSA